MSLQTVEVLIKCDFVAGIELKVNYSPDMALEDGLGSQLPF
jgi:hypothetical protein